MKFVRLLCISIIFSLVLITDAMVVKNKNAIMSYSKGYNLNTGANDDGGGSIFYLDRHNVKCQPGSVLQGFHLTRPQGDKIMYEYNCLTHPSVDKQVNPQKTNFQDTDRNEKSSANYLDRHDVKCPQGQGMNSFRLIRQPDNLSRVAYDFSCSPIKTSKCASGELPWQDGDPGNGVRYTWYLDRQNLSLGNLDVLTSFKLEAQYPGRKALLRYRYTYCTLQADTTQNPATNTNPFPLNTGPNDDGQGSVFYLDRHNVKCGANEALQAFHLTRPTPNQIMYEYRCYKDEAISVNGVERRQSPFNDTNDNHRSSTHYLDRHEVRCPYGKAVSSFKLIRSQSQNDKIAYEFFCVPVQIDVCGSGTTVEQDADGSDGIKSNIYLDRQTVNLEGKNVLISFKLNTSYYGNRGRYKYTYEYCSVKSKDPAKKDDPSKDPAKKDDPSKDPAKKDDPSKDPAKKDDPTKESVRSDDPSKDPAKKDDPTKESVRSDDPSKDPAKKDDPSKDPVRSDDPSKDPVRSDDPSKDPAKKDDPSKDPAKKDDPTKDPVRSDDPSKDPAKKDDPTKDPAKKDDPTKDPAKKDDPTKDPAKKDDPTKDPAKKDDPTKDPTKDPAKKDDPTKDPTKDPAKKDDPTKDPTKDPAKKDDPTKDPSKKDNDPKEIKKKKGKKTKMVPYEKGSLKALTNLKIKCKPGQALQVMKLKVKDDKIFYKFKCLAHPSISSDKKLIRRFQTPFAKMSTSDGISNEDLKQHCTKCPENYALHSVFLKLDPEDSTKIAYEFTCVPLTNPSCSTLDTPPTSGKSKETKDLVEQKIVLKEKTVLRSFKLLSVKQGEENMLSYHLDTCSLK